MKKEGKDGKTREAVINLLAELEGKSNKFSFTKTDERGKVQWESCVRRADRNRNRSSKLREIAKGD